MKFTDKLTYLRKQLGLSQEELAHQLGLSRQAIAKWEAGITYPSIDHLISLSEILKVTIDYLVKQHECQLNYNESSSTIDVILEFRLEAASQTYAAHGMVLPPSRLGSIDYAYHRDNLTYKDSYFGGEHFAGQETIYLDNNVVYAMNYVGRVIDVRFDGDFLKRALLTANRSMPYRGPSFYEEHQLVYTSSVQGDHAWFQGYEKIECGGDVVYEAYFHGGTIK